MDKFKTKEWNKSYQRYENTLFYPKEDVISFINKYFKRANTVDHFKNNNETKQKILDLGSGSGRHLIYLYENNFNPFGVELSAVACEQALDLINHKNFKIPIENIRNKSDNKLSFADNFFDASISVSTLDSMKFETALAVMKELKRVVKNEGLIFLDLIAETSFRDGNVDSSLDQVVSEKHEKGTIQSYFNKQKIRDLISGFKIIDQYRIDKININNSIKSSRNFVIIQVKK